MIRECVFLCFFLSVTASPALRTLSELFLAYHRLITYFGHLQALHHWSKPGSSNVWRVTCGYELSWGVSHPHLSPSVASPIQKCLVPHPRDPVAFSDPREGVVSGRNASSLTISIQRPEREPHRNHLGEVHHPHLPPPHPEPAREGVATPHREMFATSIGTPVSATAGLTAHLDIRKTLPHDPATLTLLMELGMRKTQRIQPWNFLQWTT